MILLPTHKCFDDALDYLTEVMRHLPRAIAEEHVLVHGVCLGPTQDRAGDLRADEPFAHAWVERGETVTQGMVTEDGQHAWVSIERASFYEELRVQETTRYTIEQAVAENHRTGHFGPWVERYEGLCKGKGIGR